MLCLQDVMLNQLLDPMVIAVTSTQVVFTRGGSARSALTVKLLDCLCAIAIRLGADQAVRFVSEPLLKLLRSFERVGKNVSIGSPRSSSFTAASSGQVGPSHQRPDWMGHQRRLSNTLRQAQAAADIEAATQPSIIVSSRPAATGSVRLFGKPYLNVTE